MSTASDLVEPHAIGNVPRSETEPLNLVCSEVWGGNRAFHGPVELPGMRGVLYSQPCDGARGGDVHYLSVCGSGLISRACLADVTGHGQSVSAVSQVMHDLLLRSMNRMDERKVLRRLNLRLAGLDDGTFTTAAAFSYLPPMRRLSISYAGHEPAWYYEASSGRWFQLEPNRHEGLFDMVLAVAPRTRYSRLIRRVAFGDRLVMFTDGVIEAPSPSRELFGRGRLATALSANNERSPGDMVRDLIQSLREHTEGAPLHHDDVSVLAVEFVDNLKSSALWTAIRNRLLGGSPKVR